MLRSEFYVTIGPTIGFPKGPLFRWDEARCFVLHCKLVAAYFHLDGIGRENLDYVMETFPIIKRKDEPLSSEYRIKRLILEIYKEL